MTFMRKIYIKILAQDTLLVLSKVEIRPCLAIVSSHPGTMWVVSRRSKKAAYLLYVAELYFLKLKSRYQRNHKTRTNKNIWNCTLPSLRKQIILYIFAVVTLIQPEYSEKLWQGHTKKDTLDNNGLSFREVVREELFGPSGITAPRFGENCNIVVGNSFLDKETRSFQVSILLNCHPPRQYPWQTWYVECVRMGTLP